MPPILLRAVPDHTSGVASDDLTDEVTPGSPYLPQFPLGEERAQLRIGFLRRLLGEIVAARQRPGTADIGRVVRPDLGRRVVARDRAGRAPQDQRRTGDLAAGGD